MNIGVDIDGTITAMPDVFRTICRSLMARGNRVYIVTAQRTDHHNDPQRTTPQGRQRHLENLGFRLGIHYNSIVMCPGDSPAAVAQAKKHACEQLHLDVMFDNDPLNVAACREVTKVLVPSDDPPVYR